MEDRSGQVLAVAIIFTILSWTSVCLRVYVRTCMIKAFGKDDVAMVVTLLFFTVYLVCQIGGVMHGTGQHRSAITDANAQIALRYWFFCEISFTLATSMLKIAIGLFLLRITVDRTHIWIIRIIMIGSIVTGFIYTFILLFQCQPISYWWTLSPDAKGKCVSPSLEVVVFYVVSALNSLADWTFGILPFFIVKDLQMKKSLKAVVATILGFAAIGSAATIIRMPYLWTVKGYKGDFLWRTTDVALWTTVEVGVGITAGCVATLKPLLKSFLNLIGAHSTSRPDTGGPSSGWSHAKRKAASKQGYSRHDQPLDELRPAYDRSLTTTTVTGNELSLASKGTASCVDRTQRDSGEEHIFIQRNAPDIDFPDTRGWKGGINKSVAVTTTEERSPPHPQPGRSGGRSLHDDTDEERSLPGRAAVVYERF